jgi:Mg-chelatase subunit ChlI
MPPKWLSTAPWRAKKMPIRKRVVASTAAHPDAVNAATAAAGADSAFGVAAADADKAAEGVEPPHTGRRRRRKRRTRPRSPLDRGPRPCAQTVHSSGSDSPTEDAEEDKTVRPDRANESGSPSVDAEAAPTASGSKQDAASARVGDAIADTGLGSADVAVSSNDVLKSKSNEIIWDDL